MLSDKIQALAAELFGNEDARLNAVCSAVCQMLSGCLKSGISPDDCEDSFTFAAALYAVSFMRKLDDQALSSFDAGTLKLTFRDSQDTLVQMAQQLLAPWCHDSTAFKGVRA